jgi:hypothetical protein
MEEEVSCCSSDSSGREVCFFWRLDFASAVVFFGGFTIDTSLLGSIVGFSFEAKVTEIASFCILGSSSTTSSLRLKQSTDQANKLRETEASNDNGTF